jgi:hypothetical protein
MVVREHYKKFGDIRLLELLYDDLRTWNDWALAKRALPAGKKTHLLRDLMLKMIVLPRQARDKHRQGTQKREMPLLTGSPPGPGGLISVGSDVVNTSPHDGHTKQAAIWETGMDNSPM